MVTKMGQTGKNGHKANSVPQAGHFIPCEWPWKNAANSVTQLNMHRKYTVESAIAVLTKDHRLVASNYTSILLYGSLGQNS